MTRSECDGCGSTTHTVADCPFEQPRSAGATVQGVLTGARLGEVFMNPNSEAFDLLSQTQVDGIITPFDEAEPGSD